MLDRHQHRAAPFAADGNSLKQTHDHQQHGGPVTDALIGRNQTDKDGGNTHQDQRNQQHRFSTDAIAKMTEHNAAERAREKAYRIGRECRQRTGDGIETWKEDLVEDQRSRRAIKKKIVPLDGGANHARKPGDDIVTPPTLRTNAF